MAASAGGNYPWKEPATTVARGAFIVIEGLDRSGKTTQVKKLCDALYDAGHNVQALRFPGMPSHHVAQLLPCSWSLSPAHTDLSADRTTPIGKMIDSYLQSKTEMDDHSIHLLFSANRWEKAYVTQSVILGITDSS
jgi:dTMP kinase